MPESVIAIDGKALVIYKANDGITGDHGRIEQRTIETIPTEALKSMFDSRWK